MGSGGGVAGAVDFPDYIENTHRLLLFGDPTDDGPEITDLSYDVLDILKNAVNALPSAGNPYTGAAFTNPATDLAVNQTRFAAYETYKGTAGASAITQHGAFLDAILARITNGDLFRKVYTSGFRGLAASNAQFSIEDFSDEFDPGLDEQADFEAILDTVVTKLGEAGVITSLDLPALFESALENASAVIEAAVQAAANASTSVDLEPLFDAQDDRIDTAKDRAMREFHAGMADINAVHSTAFVWGTALLENEALREKAAYRTEVEMRIYETSLRSFGAIYGSVLQGGISAALDNNQQRNQILRDSVGFVVQMLMNRTSYKQAFGALFAQVFGMELDASLKAELMNANLHTNTLLNGIQGLAQIYEHRIDHEQATVNVQAELNRLKIVALQEYEGADIDLGHKHAMFPIEIYEKGANILAAPAGMGAMVPNSPSKAGSAIGGALGGAVLGAKVGSMIPGGTAIGAGIGGVLGGIAGLLG